MFVEFLYELRKRGVKVGPQEALALSDALALELHDTTLDGFYDVARALLVHREQDLDAFDTAFAAYFEGIEVEALQLTEELLEGLENAAPRGELTDEERELLEKIDLKEARRRLMERCAENRRSPRVARLDEQLGLRRESPDASVAQRDERPARTHASPYSRWSSARTTARLRNAETARTGAAQFH